MMKKKCLNCKYATNIQKDPGGYRSFKTKREHLQGYCSLYKEILYDYQLHRLCCSFYKPKEEELLN